MVALAVAFFVTPTNNNKGVHRNNIHINRKNSGSTNYWLLYIENNHVILNNNNNNMKMKKKMSSINQLNFSRLFYFLSWLCSFYWSKFLLLLGVIWSLHKSLKVGSDVSV